MTAGLRSQGKFSVPSAKTLFPVMISRSIRERLRRQPFEPFVIRASSGQKVRVASPDLAVLMKSEMFVAEPNSDHYLHIAGLESGSNGGGNGRSSRRPRRR